MTRRRFAPNDSIRQAIVPALALLTVLVVLPVSLRAQSYHIRTYTEQDGLPCYAVMGVAQDGAGRMWFATNEGMVCYDGLEWTTHAQEQGLWRKGHRDAVASADGGIWAVDVRTPIALSHFDGQAWSRIPKPESDSDEWWEVVEISAGLGRDGREYVAVATARGHVSIWNGRSWHTARLVSTPDRITALALHGGLCHVATPAGLVSLDPSDGALVERASAGMPAGPVLGVAGSLAGDALWIVGETWLGKLGDGVFDLVREPLDVQFTTMRYGVSVLEDQLGGLYFGDAVSVYYHRDACPLEILTRESGLSSDGVSDFLLDREGNIWIASQRGVSKIVSRSFAGYSRRQGLYKDEVTAIHERRSGRIVLGHTAGLTFLEDEPRVLTFDEHTGKTSRIIDIEEDGSGDLWLACDRFGLGRLDAGDRITWHRESHGLQGSVYAILFDRAGRMWVGTQVGLFRRSGERFVRVELPDLHTGSSRSLPVRRLSEGPDDAIYVATRLGGLYRLRGDEVTLWQDPGGPVGNDIYCGHAFADGRIWVGTAGGLSAVAGDELAKAVAPDPVIDRPIYSILEDERGRVWFGTDAGVLRWDGRRLEHFTVKDGLYGRETNRDALLLASDGDVWIGTDSGVWVYREEFDLPPLAAPLLEFRELVVDGRPYPVDEDFALDSPAGQISIRFRGLSFLDEDRMRYRTWLDPFQPDFEPARSLPLQEVRYTNVPPGEYRFHVQAVAADGGESAVATTGLIKVHPVFWLRWWAHVIYVLLVLGVLWAVFSLRTRRLYAEDLEEEVRARTLKLQASERAVRDESRKLEATLLNISDGVLALDRDMDILLANPAAETLLDVESREIVGRPIASVLEGRLETDGGRRPAGDSRALLTDMCGRAPRVFRYVSHEGLSRDLEISATAMRQDNGSEPGLVLAFRDMTARRRLETELARSQRLESLGLLAGGIAHDFNNLLTVIQGYLALASAHTVDRVEQDRLYGTAMQATRNASLLTQQLLTFAKGGTPKLQISAVDDVVADSVGLVMSGSGVVCKVERDQDLRCIEVDPAQISQVIGNILMNARQAMDDSGTIRVSCRNRDPSGEGAQVVIAIADEGPGIPAEDLPRIFDPYFTTKETGNGLGLAIVHSIIERHRGRLEVETEPGRGTTFVIYLPATDERPRPATERRGPAVVGTGRILVLDDDEDIRLLLARMLSELGYDSDGVAEGRQAIEAYERARAEKRPYAATILDLTIPGGMGGLEAFSRLREIDPEVRGIVSSGYSDDPVLADYRRHGLAGRLEKPYDADLLRDVLANALGAS